MTTANKMMTVGFLGLASLFTAGNALAEHKPLAVRGGSDDVRFNVELRTGDGAFVFGNGRPSYQCSPREVIERVWVPARYEDRHTQVLVERGHYEDRHTRVLVQAGYFQEVKTQVLVERGHYIDRHTNVLVERGHWENRYTAPVYQTIYDRHGCKTVVLVRAGCNERIWVPDRYETRCEKVWVPDRYETRCEKVWVPERYENRCEKVWVPDRYETRCDKVLVPGYWNEVRRVVQDHNHGPQLSVRIGDRRY